MSHAEKKKSVWSCGRSRAGYVAAAVFLAGIILFLHAAAIVAQPQALLSPRPKKVHLNRLLHVTLELTWTGEADLYDIPQPDFSALAEFEVVQQSLSAVRRAEENVLVFQFALKPGKVGTYDLNGMAVRYFEKGKDVATAVSLPATPVEVLPPEMIGSRTKAGIAAGVTIAAGVVALIHSHRRKKRARTKLEEKESSNAFNRNKYHAETDAARRLLIEGETGEYMETLCRLLESDTLRPHANKLEEVRQLADSIKYGGAAASPDQLKWADRAVRESIKKAFPSDAEREEQEI